MTGAEEDVIVIVDALDEVSDSPAALRRGSTQAVAAAIVIRSTHYGHHPLARYLALWRVGAEFELIEVSPLEWPQVEVFAAIGPLFVTR